MKIVVLDGYSLNPGDLSWEGLEEFGQLDIHDRTPSQKVNERIKDAQAIFVNKVAITKDIVEKNKNLKYIGVFATGYDLIDLDATRKADIVVTNIPSYGTDSVSQHAFAMLLELTNRVAHHDRAVKQGRWSDNKDWTFWDYPLSELANKTMGIVGFGRIGQQTGKIAKAFNMNVIVNDPYKNPQMIKENFKYVDLDEIYEKSDVIVLHCNLTDENKGMINKKSIEKMKKIPYIINNSRGPLINESDLVEALENKKIRGAGLDVLETEPPSKDNPLYKFDNVL